MVCKLFAEGKWIRTPSPRHHHAGREVRARGASTVSLPIFAAPIRFGGVGPASHRSPIRGAFPCGSLWRKCSKASRTDRSAAAVLLRFVFGNLGPTDHGAETIQRTAIAQLAKLIGQELKSPVGPSEQALATGPMLAEAGATTEIVERLFAEAQRKRPMTG